MTIRPSELSFEGTKGHVQNGPLLRDVDLLALEHGIDASPQAGLLRQLQKEPECFVGDAVLRIVEIDADCLSCQALLALGIVREELPKMQLPSSSDNGLRGPAMPRMW